MDSPKIDPAIRAFLKARVADDKPEGIPLPPDMLKRREQWRLYQAPPDEAGPEIKLSLYPRPPKGRARLPLILVLSSGMAATAIIGIVYLLRVQRSLQAELATHVERNDRIARENTTLRDRLADANRKLQQRKTAVATPRQLEVPERRVEPTIPKPPDEPRNVVAPVEPEPAVALLPAKLWLTRENPAAAEETKQKFPLTLWLERVQGDEYSGMAVSVTPRETATSPVTATLDGRTKILTIKHINDASARDGQSILTLLGKRSIARNGQLPAYRLTLDFDGRRFNGTFGEQPISGVLAY